MTISASQIQADRFRRIADWSDLRFQPAIVRGEDVYQLPRPVTQVALKETWDSERFKTLLVDGDTTVGSTRNGVEITVTGSIGSLDAETFTPVEMFAALAELRAQVHAGPDEEDKYRFDIYRDAGSATTRYFQSCSTVRLETDVSNAAAFRYRLVIHADDPQIYEESEGE